MNRANEVRPLLKKLGEVAERTDCAIVIIGHLNKASGQQSGYRNLGSIDFIAAARSVLLIGKSKDDPNIRVLVHDKSSKTYRARIFNGNTAPSVGAWINYAGIRVLPQASSKAKKCGSLAAAAKHLQKYATPGDIILYGSDGSNGRWVHAAIYSGGNDGSTYKEIAAHGSGYSAAYQISEITKTKLVHKNDTELQSAWVLIVRATGSSTQQNFQSKFCLYSLNQYLNRKPLRRRLNRCYQGKNIYIYLILWYAKN